MQRFTTKAIVLSRTDFGEADRIVTFLTPDHGKVRGMARGVRKQKSKLAGGIELFSISEVTFMVGRSEINTVISTRLITHFGQIVKDLDRTNAGYDFIKTLDKLTEDNPDESYFDLLAQTFQALDDDSINLDFIKVWVDAQLLRLAGHSPNLQTDVEDYKLEQGKAYDFNFDQMCFQKSATRRAFGQNEIKFMRLIFSNKKLSSLQKIKSLATLSAVVLPLVRSMMQQHQPHR